MESAAVAALVVSLLRVPPGPDRTLLRVGAGVLSVRTLAVVAESHLSAEGRGIAAARPGSRRVDGALGRGRSCRLVPCSALRPTMLRWLASLFQTTPRAVRVTFQDADLGLLSPDADGNCWKGEILIGGETIGFKIGGEAQPDPGLLAHARDIVKSFDAFQRMVTEFLARQARQQEPEWLQAAADEIK